MRKNTGRPKLLVQEKSVIATARRAVVHVVVFSVISLAGHGVTTSLSAAAGSVGSAIVPPIGGMFLI